MKQLHIKFKYKDRYTYGEWAMQECVANSIQQCIEFYGLDEPDVEYEIIEMKEV